MDSRTLLKEIRARLRALEDSLRSADVAHVVEVGTVLHTVSKDVEAILGEVKETLRTTAQAQYTGEPLAVTLHGITAPATVSFGKKTLGWVKGADPNYLKGRMGDRFDLFVESSTTFKPRENVPSLIIHAATDVERGMLLSSIEEKESTPRVSLTKLP